MPLITAAAGADLDEAAAAAALIEERGFDRGQSLSEAGGHHQPGPEEIAPGAGWPLARWAVSASISGVAAGARASAGASCRSGSASGPQRVHAASSNAQNRVSVSASVVGLQFARIFAAG